MDYQDFREWASRRYLKPQIAAIRAADRRHMVTISNHSRCAIGLWEGAARPHRFRRSRSNRTWLIT